MAVCEFLDSKIKDSKTPFKLLQLCSNFYRSYVLSFYVMQSSVVQKQTSLTTCCTRFCLPGTFRCTSTNQLETTSISIGTQGYPIDRANETAREHRNFRFHLFITRHFHIDDFCDHRRVTSTSNLAINSQMTNLKLRKTF